MIVNVIGLLLVSGVACQGAEIWDEFLAAHSDEKSVPFATDGEHDTGKVTEVGIEHTACHGFCAQYAFTVRSDGTYKLTVLKDALPAGITTGTMAEDEFQQTFWKISQTGFFTYANSYSEGIIGHSSTYLKVVKDGKTKIVLSYAGAGPLELMGIIAAIDQLALKAGLTLPAEP